jgi:hypothetical protein
MTSCSSQMRLTLREPILNTVCSSCLEIADITRPMKRPMHDSHTVKYYRHVYSYIASSDVLMSHGLV